jgi:hypothetical protein
VRQAEAEVAADVARRRGAAGLGYVVAELHVDERLLSPPRVRISAVRSMLRVGARSAALARTRMPSAAAS